MEKNKYITLSFLLVILLFCISCSLKKENYTIDTNIFNYGIKFQLNDVTYFCSKTSEELQPVKQYTMSVNIVKSSNDTVLNCQALTYNTDKYPNGAYQIRITISIHHFSGKGVYDKNKTDIFVDLNDLSSVTVPPGCMTKDDGSFVIGDFDWVTQKGKGTFYFRWSRSSGCNPDYPGTITLNNGVIIF